jgi:hypothetical protein
MGPQLLGWHEPHRLADRPQAGARGGRRVAARELQHDREGPGGREPGGEARNRAANVDVLQHERGVDEVEAARVELGPLEIDAAELERRAEPHEALPRDGEVGEVHVQPDGAARDGRVDVLEPVPRRDPEHRQPPRPARRVDLAEDGREGRQLVGARRAHVRLVLGGGDERPGVRARHGAGLYRLRTAVTQCPTAALGVARIVGTLTLISRRPDDLPPARRSAPSSIRGVACCASISFDVP